MNYQLHSNSFKKSKKKKKEKNKQVHGTTSENSTKESTTKQPFSLIFIKHPTRKQKTQYESNKVVLKETRENPRNGYERDAKFVQEKNSQSGFGRQFQREQALSLDFPSDSAKIHNAQAMAWYYYSQKLPSLVQPVLLPSHT